MADLATVHIDQALTNVSIMYSNETYIGEQVIPVLPVEKRSDKFFRYKREDFLSGSGIGADGKPLSLRRPKSKSAEVDYGNDTDNYNCEEYSLSDIIPDEVMETYDNPLDPQIDSTEFLTQRLKIDNELASAALVNNTAGFPGSNKVTLTTGGAGTSFASYTSPNSNPFTVINNAKIAVQRGIALLPNTFALGQDVAQVLSNHPLIVARTQYTHMDALTNAGLPKVVQGLTVLEGGAQANTGAEGAAYAGGYIWSATNSPGLGFIFYRNPNPRPRSVSFAYTFDAPGATTKVRGLAARKYRDEDRKGLKVEVSFTRTWKSMAVDSNGLSLGGYQITGAIS